MAEAIFDKDGALMNADQLSPQEIAGAYHEKQKVSHGRALAEEARRKEAEDKAAKALADLEAERTKNTKPPEPEKKQDPPKQEISTDELKLIARGLSDEEIEEAKSIATGKGISLTEALKTKSFKLFQDDLKEEKRKEQAKLGPAGGSSPSLPDVGMKSGMSREEHLAAFKKATGK